METSRVNKPGMTGISDLLGRYKPSDKKLNKNYELAADISELITGNREEKNVKKWLRYTGTETSLMAVELAKVNWKEIKDKSGIRNKERYFLFLINKHLPSKKVD